MSSDAGFSMQDALSPKGGLYVANWRVAGEPAILIQGLTNNATIVGVFCCCIRCPKDTLSNRADHYGWYPIYLATCSRGHPLSAYEPKLFASRPRFESVSLAMSYYFMTRRIKPLRRTGDWTSFKDASRK